MQIYWKVGWTAIAAMAPHNLQPPRPAPRKVLTTSLRHDEEKATGTTPTPTYKARQASPPMYQEGRADNVRKLPEAPVMASGTNRSEASVVNLSTVDNASYSSYYVKCDTAGNLMEIKRPIPPCPCPEDIKPRVRVFPRIAIPVGAGEGAVPLGVKDQMEYCRFMKAKLNELHRTAGPVQRNMRTRLVAEQTWFELQSNLFLKPPHINRRTFNDVLHNFDKKRDKLARKERHIWKQVPMQNVP